MKRYIVILPFAVMLAAFWASHPQNPKPYLAGTSTPAPTATPSGDAPHAHRIYIPPGDMAAIYAQYKARTTPVPTATPGTDHPHSHAIEMPQAHFHWLDPHGDQEAIMDRFDKSDPAMIAALQAGELTAFEVKNGHRPVKWGDDLYKIK